MTRTLAAALAATLLSAAPALAQPVTGGNERVNVVIVYGDDACPESTGDEIVVCPRKEEAERYRIPEMFRGSDSPQNEAWTNRVERYEMVGRNGTLSCTPTGPGGSTGCLARMIETAYDERGLAPDVRFAELINAERERRLSTIDADAAEAQARVETIEREYEERRRREEAAASGVEDANDAPPPPPPTAPPPGN